MLKTDSVMYKIVYTYIYINSEPIFYPTGKNALQEILKMKT